MRNQARPLGFRRGLVVGTVRNASNNVTADLLRIVDSLDAIVPTSGFVVESDSDDTTVRLLSELASKDSRIRFVSLGQVSPQIPDRIARLRHCRNAYVREIRENPEYKDCDLVIVADLDGINTKISTQYLERALSSEVQWDAMAANQSARYYDILALRHPLWSPNNWLMEAEWLRPFLGEKVASRHSLADRMIRIPSDLPPILVDSAFGGLCVYRRWIFDECDYSEDIPEAADEIDHVTLHRKARLAGGKIYIHPGLINSNWTAHSLNGSPFIRISKSFAHTLPFRFLLPILRKISLFAAK
ncbi:MAG: hypothetical protein HY050_03525 [Actinobacteria bacterium]|nr:hypothetical protein [Actinomycetota bacterium]